MFLLIFYHTGRLFDQETWHIKNEQLSPVINTFNRFMDIWQMPLFFLLAGASIWYALGKRTPGGFAKERVLRLLVPLIFGMLIVVPPQVYLQRVFDGDFSGSFLSWYPNTFQGTYSMDDPSAGNLSWHHLWFLIYLFAFSLILLPVFLYFRKEKRAPLISGIAQLMEKPGAIFLPAIPLIVINITLRSTFGWGNQNLIWDWANFLYYMSVVFYGFLIVSDRRIIGVIQRNLFTALVVAGIFSSLLLLSRFDKPSLPGPLYDTLNAAACWCWLIALIGIGSRLFNLTNRVLRYTTDAVLPVYIVHQTIIIALGFYIVKWDTSIVPKYFLVGVATLVLSLAVYEIVRRTSVTRFLFGIKARRHPV